MIIMNLLELHRLTVSTLLNFLTQRTLDFYIGEIIWTFSTFFICLFIICCCRRAQKVNKTKLYGIRWGAHVSTSLGLHVVECKD